MMHKIVVTEQAANSGDRNSIGGAPIFAQHQEHPRCKICNAEMTLFLQFDIKAEFSLPFQVGNHLLVFMCPNHNELPLVPEDYDSPELPKKYWEQDSGHYALILNRPDVEEIGVVDRFIAAKQIEFIKAEETVTDLDNFLSGSPEELKVGGVPGWLNYSVAKQCQCGGELRFTCQIPDWFGFDQTAIAPPQPHSFSATQYCLLLGNQVYILACENQCCDRALIAVCDN